MKVISIILALAAIFISAPASFAEFQISYGKFEVPLVHASPNGERINIVFAKMHKNGARGQVPHFYFSGGPGQSATRIADRYKKSGKLSTYLDLLLDYGPIYFVDQRGTGKSEPKLRCKIDEQLPLIAKGEPENYLAKLKLVVEKCKEAMNGYSKYLNAMNTEETVKDFEVLRKEIGAEKITISGGSYGTHAALSYIRLFGWNVNKAILSLIEGPNHTFKLPLQFDQSIERIDERRALVGLPALAPLMLATFDQFSKEGKQVVFRDKFGEHKIIVSRFELALYVQHFASMKRIEKLYTQLKDKNYSRLAKFAAKRRSYQRFHAKYYSTDCASGASKFRMVEIRKQQQESILGAALNFPFPYVCEIIGVAPLDDRFREPIQSDIPILAFSGNLDYKTPAANAEEVASGFSKFIHVADGAGFHSFCKKDICNDILKKFLASPVSEIHSKTIEIE